MIPFSVTIVDRRKADQFEPLGSKPKFWFRDGERRLMFKADDRGTGEDWAEVVACELCKLVGLPHVHYDLAAEGAGDQTSLPGVICENMAPPPKSLVLGNQLLLAADGTYPMEQRFKVSQHTVEMVAKCLSTLWPPEEDLCKRCPSLNRGNALDFFVGYALLDAWIANQDRHHENWAAVWTGERMRLAPTFDHGAALARNLTDSERRERLSTRDRNRTIKAFARRARSAFYANETDKKALSTLDAFLAFGILSPKASNAWLERVLAVGTNELSAILDRVPSSRISDVGREFTLALLLENQQRLREANP
ncbi:hypothetical protein Pla123a_25350 [Posidoniimonas polymericola]|uniref:HipA-like C-terminal domain-containing protein n=1 Tax=Posidoniimonas polymericola TaxID=2528002 RepID=A0A5C5YQB5_9BACT|nr:phosphatidylinositol kinase [Posidoniimonas polymericola]TWT77105.1 hypothetical protein Pla123a_25350 [Posidoniimonas polymericola]